MTRPSTVPGSCQCGAVRFTLAGPIDVVNYCHCSRCRKRTGSAFATMIHAGAADFAWVAGTEAIEVFTNEAGRRRSFCRRCGSPLPAILEDDGGVVIPAGLLDGELGARPSLHIMVGSKASWFEIHDSLPQHDEFPEDW